MSDQPGPGQQGQPQQQQRTRRPYGDRPADMSAGLATVTAPAPKGIDTRAPVGLTTLNSLDDAYRYAYAMAGSSLLPRDLAHNAPNTLIVILYGQYLGIPPVIATQVISVVNGRPQLEGKMLITKIREAGHKFRPIEQTNEKCVVRITRKDEPDDPYFAEFTIDEAITAELCYRDPEDGTTIRARSDKNKPLPWELYTKDMLLWRATARCCNVACPEVKMGMMVEGEEVTADHSGSRAERLGRVAAQRADQQPAGDTPADADPADVAADVAAQLAAMEAHHTPTADQDVQDAELVTETAGEPTEEDRWDEVLDAEQRDQGGEQGGQGKGRGRK